MAEEVCVCVRERESVGDTRDEGFDLIAKKPTGAWVRANVKKQKKTNGIGVVVVVFPVSHLASEDM